MNRYRTFLTSGILSFLFVSCTQERGCDTRYSLINEQNTIKFAVHPLITSVEEGPLSRSVTENPENIKQIWCVVQEEKGDVLRTFHLKGIEMDKLYIEGIEPGSYTAYFMATTEDISTDTTVPEDVTQPWINDPKPGLPFEKDYLYKKVDFTVSSKLTNQTVDIKLPRVTGHVKVLLNLSNPQLEQLIQKVEVIFDEEAKVSNCMLGNGTYTGTNSLNPIDITNTGSFFSLPGEDLSGIVRITQKITPGSMETSVTDYRFSHLDIVPGFISTVKIEYSHSEGNYGEIKVKESSYTTENSSTMFRDNEPPSMIITRRFKVNAPLNINIDTENKLLVARLYSPMELRNTQVWIKFRRYSDKYFLLAQYDVIHPFQESKMKIPVMSDACKFIAEDGEQLWVPAQENLSMNHCELKVVYANTSYIQKIQSIKCNWTIGFQEASRDPENPPETLDMTPITARHICVLAVNIAYMFSTDRFRSELNKLNGLYDDNKKTIDKNVLMNQVLKKEAFYFGILEKTLVGSGHGAYNKLEMWQEYYSSFYADKAVNRQAWTTLFHEIGHCLGYGHNSTMTYDRDNGEVTVWPPFCIERFYELRIGRELPVSEDIVSRLPR